nr:transposase (putative), gypsy type [Tanacetum cinerariifolium]
SQQVATLQQQVSGEEKLKAAFEEFKREGLRHGLEYGQAQRSLESIEAYDPEAEAKFVAALQALKDLKYPLVDQLEGLRDAPMDVIMAALYLESDTGDDASQDIRD